MTVSSDEKSPEELGAPDAHGAADAAVTEVPAASVTPDSPPLHEENVVVQTASASPTSEASTEVEGGNEAAQFEVPAVAPVDPGVLASRRVLWRVLLLVVLLSAIAVVQAIARAAVRPTDLAAGKPWRASSTLFQCHPEAIECGGTRTSIFFHTQEEDSPWVEFDLGTAKEFRSLWVRNRADAVRERAVPLIAEVSDDRANWREVARRDEVFTEWTPSFAPTTARYVRLRAARRTFLHLTAVQVWP